MKIAWIDIVFDRHLPVGSSGLSEVVWELAGPLAACGHEVHIIAPYLNDRYPAPGVHVHRFALPPIGYRNILGHMLIVQHALDSLRRQGPFDIVHAPEYLSTALACRAGLTPVVLTEPGNIFERIANGNPYDRFTTQVYKWAARTSARGCARIIATSALMADWWQRSGALPAQIARIPLGVRLDGFAPQPDARRRHGWDADRPQVLFVARLSPETGAALLLRALPQVLAVFPQLQVHLVGSGPAEAELRAQAASLQIAHAIIWHGWVKLAELPGLYNAADMLVFPGSSGGTPRVMLQAMACGTPFVGTAIGGIVDHVDANRGWLVPPNDATALAAAIIAALRSPDLRLARATAARSYVHSLDWSTIAARVATEVYTPLIERGVAL